MKFASIQSRIVLFHLLAVMFAAAAVSATSYLVINRSTNLFEARILQAHAEDVARYLHIDEMDAWHLNLPENLASLYRREFEGLSFQIVTDAGQKLFSSGGPSDGAEFPLTGGGLFRLSHKSQDLYGFVIPRVEHGKRAWIAVFQNTQNPDVIFDDIISYYLARIGWLTIAILALVLLADIIAIRRAVAPVIAASKIATLIDPKRMELRLPAANMPQEIEPLVVAMNHALDRLEEGIKLQRDFTADAAHELRTPLAILRARLDTLPASQAVADAKGDVDAMANAVAELLEMADLESANVLLADAVDLRELTANMVTVMAPIAIAHGKELAFDACDRAVFVTANEAMLQRAIRNLIDNAIKYTTKGTTVEVQLDKEGILKFMDRGPGIPASERHLVFQRFWRARRDNVEGVGLGLPIVARIAQLNGFLIKIADRDGGGTCISLVFSDIGMRSG